MGQYKSILDDVNEFAKEQKKIRDEKRKILLRKNKIIEVILLAVLFILILIPTIKFCSSLKYTKYADNILYRLDYLYNDKFTLIDPQMEILDVTKTPSGKYIFSSKYGFTFKAIQSNTKITTDYPQYIYKKLVLEFIDKNPNNSIFYEDNTNNDFLAFKFGIIVNDYDDPNNEFNDFINLNKYIKGNISKYFDNDAYLYTLFIKYKNFEFGIDSPYLESNDKEYYIKQFRVKYNNYLKENTISGEFYDGDYYKPDMFIKINGTDVIDDNSFLVVSRYSFEQNDYIVNIGRLEKYIKDFCEISRATNGKLVSLTYNGKHYLFAPNNEVDNMITENKVPYEWTISQIEDFFNASVTYDYDEKVININIGNIEGS